MKHKFTSKEIEEQAANIGTAADWLKWSDCFGSDVSTDILELLKPRKKAKAVKKNSGLYLINL